MALSDCTIIELPKIHDYRGNLSIVEAGRQIPFEIKRVYYLYDVPGGASRAGHAHRQLHQLMIPMSGSFDVTLDDGRDKKKFHMNRPNFGLYLAPMIWRDIGNFSSGAVCMNIASDFYDEADYMRTYDEFLKEIERRG